MKAILSPSLLSADFSALGSEAEALGKAGVQWLHLDVMDGEFVPNITFGAPVIKSLRRSSNLFFDVHLMIDEPGRYVSSFVGAGADMLVIHQEACRHPQRVLCQIRESGIRAGLALNPGSDFSLCRWLLPCLDMILIMGVNPGFSGQAFIPETTGKVQACRQYLKEHNFGSLPVQVDGGVCLANAASLASAGATVLVSGSAFFSTGDYREAMSSFNLALEKAANLDQDCLEALEIAKSWCHNTAKG